LFVFASLSGPIRLPDVSVQTGEETRGRRLGWSGPGPPVKRGLLFLPIF
jgi:hypothetical protein